MRKYLAGAALAAIVTLAGSAWAWDDMANNGYGTSALDALYCRLAGCALTGAVTTTNNISSGDAGPLELGGDITSAYSQGSNDVIVKDNLELGNSVIAGYGLFATQVVSTGLGTATYLGLSYAADRATIYTRTTGVSNNVTFESAANYQTTRSWAAQAGAVRVGVCSPLAIATNATRCGYFEHRGTASDGSSFFIGSLSGPVAIKGAGFNLPEVTSDPCAGANYDVGSLFFNITSGYPCMCNGSRADVKLTDNTTACF